MAMKRLETMPTSQSSMTLERAVAAKLRESGLGEGNSLRVRLLGQRLIVDGFVADLKDKAEAEAICRQWAPGKTVVNRLRLGIL